MPTRTGSIWAQYVGYHWVYNSSHTITVNPANRDITADSAISLNVGSGWGECGIWRIVSNGHLEEFDPPLPSIMRDNVTQIVFRVRASSSTRVWARHVINYWN
jgi:hypothetical protein